MGSNQYGSFESGGVFDTNVGKIDLQLFKWE